MAQNDTSSIQRDLDFCRREIDRVDEQIISLLGKRTAISRAIGQIKRRGNLPIVDPLRELQVIDRLVKMGRNQVHPDMIRRIFREIIFACRSAQTRINTSIHSDQEVTP